MTTRNEGRPAPDEITSEENRMALLAMAWAMDAPDLTSTEKITLIAIASFTDKHGNSAWPSVATLQKKTSLGERTVRRSVGYLVDKGWIIENQAPNPTGRSFTLNMERLRVVGEIRLAHDQVGVPERHPPLPEWHPPPATVAPNPSNDPYSSFSLSAEAPKAPGTSLDQMVQVKARFDLWWESWGNKVGKKAAARAWVRVDLSAFDAIMEDTENRAERGYFAGEAVLNPATYLNQERWTDEPPNRSVSRGTSTKAYQRESAVDRVKRKGEERLRAQGNIIEGRFSPGATDD